MSADPVWEALVTLVLPLGAHERRSRYADKPALMLGARDIARLAPLIEAAVRADR